MMEAYSRQRNLLTTPRKLRRVLDMIRGKSVVEAFSILRLSPYAASHLVMKKLLEAVSNAQVRYGISPDGLKVSRAFADEGPRMTRFKPRAQGRVYRRMRRTAHLTLAVAPAHPLTAGARTNQQMMED